MWSDKILYQIWTQSSYPRRSYCDFNIWPNDLEHVWRVALGSGIIFTTFDLRNLSVPELWRFYADMLCYPVTLTCDLWPFDLELLQHFGCHALKLCMKSERSRIIHGWVIDDLARFRGAILGDGAQLTELSIGIRGPNFTKRGQDIGRSFLHQKFVSAFRYLAAFLNAGGSNLIDIENDTKFRSFWPPPCEN